MPRGRPKKEEKKDEEEDLEIVDLDEEEAEDEYVVEEILDKRRWRGGRVQYLLKWQGYPTSDATWEYESALNCPELVKLFEEKRPKEVREKEKQEEEKRKAKKKRGRPPMTPEQKAARAEEKKMAKKSDEEDDSTEYEEDAEEEPSKKVRKPDEPAPSAAAAATAAAAAAVPKVPAEGEKKKEQVEDVEMEEAEKREVDRVQNSKKVTTSVTETKQGASQTTVGFETGATVDRIIGACMHDDQLLLYVSWKGMGSDKCSFVPSNVLRTKDPQVMIDFFQSRLKFDS